MTGVLKRRDEEEVRRPHEDGTEIGAVKAASQKASRLVS